MELVLPEVWLPAVAAFIPVLSAFAVSQDGTNRQRAAIAVIASGALAATETIVSGNTFTLEQLAISGLTAIVTQLALYASLWGPIVNVNALVAPKFGIKPADSDSMNAGNFG